MTFAMTIEGRPVRGTRRLPVVDPATGAVVADAPISTPAQLDEAVRAAGRAFPAWALRTEDERRAALLACSALLHDAVEELATLLTAEQGKPLRDARAEVTLAADWFRHTAELSLPAERLGGGPDSRIVMHRLPVGPVAAIAPSNFPVILSVTKIAPALFAGNTVVVKPSPDTPLTTLRMVELLASALPPGVLNAVCGDAALGAALAGHELVRLVSFTGSVRAGRAVAGIAGAGLRRVVLELGGNDACVVLPGADVGAVAPQIFGLATVNSGQFCAAVKRIYVPRADEPEMLSALRAAARAATVGDGRDPSTDLGPLVSAAQRDRVAALVADAVSRGALVVTGGAPLDRPGNFYPPTVVAGLPPGTELEDEEQFGPVLPVVAYDTVEEAVERANGTRYGLGGSVWGPPDRAEQVAARLDCGTTWVNTHGELRPDVPFGGARMSGLGVEYGYWGLLEYTRISVRYGRPGC